MNPSLKNWLFVFLWMIYIALVTLYGEYIISRPAPEWLQYGTTAVLIVFSFYLAKSTFKLIINSKYFKNN